MHRSAIREARPWYNGGRQRKDAKVDSPARRWCAIQTHGTSENYECARGTQGRKTLAKSENIQKGEVRRRKRACAEAPRPEEALAVLQSAGVVSGLGRHRGRIPTRVRRGGGFLFYRRS